LPYGRGAVFKSERRSRRWERGDGEGGKVKSKQNVSYEDPEDGRGSR